MHRDFEQALKILHVDDALTGGTLGADVLGNGPAITVRSPIDGSKLAEIPSTSAEQVRLAINAAVLDFPAWRDTPAPVRGELVRRVGVKLRQYQLELATIVAWETGKILPE